ELRSTDPEALVAMHQGNELIPEADIELAKVSQHPLASISSVKGTLTVRVRGRRRMKFELTRQDQLKVVRDSFGKLLGSRFTHTREGPTDATVEAERATTEPPPAPPPLWRAGGAGGAAARPLLSGIGVGGGGGGSSDRANSFDGECVRLGAGQTEVLAVDCSDSHDGMVIGVAATKARCPIGTSVAVRLTVEDDKVLCVYLDQ